MQTQVDTRANLEGDVKILSHPQLHTHKKVGRTQVYVKWHVSKKRKGMIDLGCRNLETLKLTWEMEK